MNKIKHSTYNWKYHMKQRILGTIFCHHYRPTCRHISQCTFKNIQNPCQHSQSETKQM